MKVGMVSQWYDPEQGSAGVPGTIARALAARGLEVRVITGFPNYPHGRLYPGYRIVPRRDEVLDGLAVRRVALYPNHDPSSAKRALSYLSFAGSAATLGFPVLAGCDACLVYSTPATTAIPAMLARALRDVPFLLYIQDLWPETVLESGFVGSRRTRRLVEQALHRYCNLVYRSAGQIAVISEGMAALLVQRGVRSQKVHVVHNWVDESVFRPVATDPTLQRQLGIDGAFSVMYAGSLGELQGLDVAVRAAARLHDLPDFRLVLVGSGVAEQRLRALAAELDLDNVIFSGQRPLSEMSALLAAADVQLVCLRDLPLFHATIPSKVQSILAAGRPVIASCPGDVRRLVCQSGAGIVCRPGEPDALADAIRQMYAMSDASRTRLGTAGLEFYRAQLSEAVGSDRLTRLLKEVAR